MTPTIEIHPDRIVIPLPKKRRPGRGAIAYLIYVLDPDETWASVGAALGVDDRTAWHNARRFSKKMKIAWPPRPKRTGHAGRPWKTKNQ